MTSGNSPLQSAALPTSLWVCGIVVALPEELSTLTSHKLAQGECVGIAENILLAHAGAGPINAERAARQLIAMGANRLVSWGCAAALAPQLKPGDLVIAEQVVSEQRIAFNTDSRWSAQVQHLLSATLSFVTGSLAESSHIVAGSIDKQRIHSQTGAVALDMESGAVAKVANQAGLPCLVIRAIADPVTMDLPQAVIHAMNDKGQVELNKLLRFLLAHPWELPALIKLGLHFNAAQKSLKTMAKQISEIIQF